MGFGIASPFFRLDPHFNFHFRSISLLPAAFLHGFTRITHFNLSVSLKLSNLKRFLQSISPSVPAQYLSKVTIRGLSTCDVEYQPYFVLGDLWESFKEWSAYGSGVPLILNDSDSVVQYYVPYLSGIQIYGRSAKLATKTRQPDEDSDSDFRDSSSDGSCDYETDRVVIFMPYICCMYPIYRIPTGPTLKDLDACFLTYHSLFTPVRGTF
ncbi:uncharacterized protein [Pyrus communis]|uniref:uncharacterized protein n=1 Tax=Pyrus communis TaxID=23211 RepID=UPI0035BF34D1